MGSRGPRVSIVIVDFKGQRFLGPLFESLSVQSYGDFEVVVVDNEGSLKLPDDLCDHRIRKISVEVNLGFAGGCNLGVQEARGELIAFLNNDTVVDENWLDKLVRRIDSDSNIAVVTSKILFFPRYVSLRIDSPVFNPSESGSSSDTRELAVRVRFEPVWTNSTGVLKISGFHGSEKDGAEEWRWTEGRAKLWLPLEKWQMEKIELVVDTPIESVGENLRVKLGNQECNIVVDGKRHTLAFNLGHEECFDVVNSAGSDVTDQGCCKEIGIYEVDDGQYGAAREVSAFSGCSVLARKDAFEKADGFDAAFFAYYEDTDLSWRMRKMGWRIFYEPESCVRHHRSGTSGEQSPFFCFQIYRNMRWNVAKNASFRFAVLFFMREICCWIPDTVSTDIEYSAVRLKRETLVGMLKYLAKRIFLVSL
jgi:GT2 family glycosyltransferase